MKKTTNSNPLKFFNDAAAARKKSVNAGNDKLLKAQFGGNPQADDSYIKKMQQDDYNKQIKERDFNYNKKMSEVAERSRNPVIPAPIPENFKNMDEGFKATADRINRASSNYKPDPGFYKGPEYIYKKKGGIVKSKKK